MKILVTGGAGQVGTDLLKLLDAQGAETYCFDLFERPESTPESINWRRGDVTNPGELFSYVKEISPDIIYHLAALLSATGEGFPHRAYVVNM
ncbi:MAG: NAD-dependent epimerase/dehydratase family protein, partial [Planctomycetota bacterium]